MKPIEKITCPNCGQDSDITVYLEAPAVMRIPVKEGKLCFPEELSKDLPLIKYDEELEPYTDTVVRFSSSDGDCFVALLREDSKAIIDCPKCEKTFNCATLPLNVEDICLDE